MKKIPMLEKFAAQSLVESDGELIFSKEKFAELIVRECMDIAKQVENDKFDVAGSAEPEYRKGINDGRRNAAWGIKNRMKLHFGVEE
jgi:hypothetical protein